MLRATPALLDEFLEQLGATDAIVIRRKHIEIRYVDVVYDEVAAGALVAPFSSDELASYRNERSAAIESSLQNAIELLAPDAVAESMQR